MTIELKTGKKGELHISSEDDRLLHCRSFGTGTYVLSGCTVTMTSANKAHIAEGELMVQGGYVRITGGGEDVAISNGVAGQKRNTIIALEYTRDSNGIEAMSFVSVDGASTTETPSDPTVTTNNINTGASSSAWKFARIQLNGLTVGTPQVLFTTKTAALLDQISSLSSQVTSLQDSVTWGTSGEWIYKKYSNGYCELWCTHTYSLTRTGNYWLPDIDLPFPLYKKSGNVAEYQARVAGCDYNIGRLYASSNRTETTVNKVEIASENVKSAGDYVALIYVFGRWK